MLIKLVACEWVFTNDSWTLNLFIKSILNNALTCYQADQLINQNYILYIQDQSGFPCPLLNM